MELFISCPDKVVPSAGQYLAAHDPADPAAVLSTPLFLSEKTELGFWSAPAFPCSWQPGTRLELVGPLGRGFFLPKSIQQLGLVALGETAVRLLPLLDLAAASNAAVTLFTDLQLARLPSALEVYPLASIKDILNWADFIAIDMQIEKLANLRDFFGLSHGVGLPCPAQALVITAMPCVGKAQCGACAIRARKGWKLACEDGPVFDLNLLEW